MPISEPGERRPHRLADKGVEIVSGAPKGGVETHSKHEGSSNPEAKIEERVVDKEDFDKTKKLEDDEHGA